jgi:UDP-glucose 4-epimerase
VTESAFSGRRCVVTGGLGFIGSALAHHLVGDGAEVTIVDALIPQHGGDLRNIAGLDTVKVVRADIGDTAAVLPAVANAEYIFNVAGQVSHLESMHEPLRATST